MKQLRKTFKTSGDIQMKSLLFYNPTLTKSELEFEARGIADFLDVVFRNTCAAKYESGITRAKAIGDMVSILIVQNKIVAQLAEVVDEDYEF
jgi:hypothetical protein